jgi:iron(III) transport system permease protein
MFSRAINRDLAHLEGKGGFSLDRLMIILCYVALITVVILPVFMILYYAFWDGTKIDIAMFKQVIFQKSNIRSMWNTLV